MRIEWDGRPQEAPIDARHTLVVHRVAVVLRDEEGEPVPGQQCLVTGPGDFRLEAETDALGRVQVVAPPGDYAVSFTELDKEIWRAAPKG